MQHYRGQRTIWDQIWKDEEGNIVVWQTPNVALITWAALTTLSLFFTGKIADIFSWAGSVALITWSLLEIFRGVNYIRRLLGLFVLIFAVASLLKSF